ncbi:hypothetical protein [Cellulosimicrobium sp. CUA-896]|uniref:hypothetical protein n=1 Tax=Cellulosimicrobium sp. CUA-896 TaxID=1517881 RepID=UPI00095999D8|nr:hypothetical protein [Cellulosimicrobium sp. CUA-896]OLT54445.1 hypothetical protein BJF88_08810 [Cellulosimicrobium sp. CUA-896]
MKRLLAGAATTALALGAALVATAAPASAHTPVVDADCSSVDVALWAYAERGRANEVTVTVDGEVVEKERFGRDFRTSVDLDPTTDHEWEVEVEAADDPRWDWSDEGTTTACPSGEDLGQVGVYVYPKLDAEKAAAWENSGPQELVTGHDTAVPADPWALTWTVEPLDLDAVRDVVGEDVTDEALCTAWGVQQDLIRLPSREYDLPTDIEYSADGNHTGDFPAGSLVAWDHQDLSELLPAGTCGPGFAPGRPIAAPPAPVVEAAPVAPAAAAVCGAGIQDVVLPEDTTLIRYTATEEGVVAEAADGVTLADVPDGYVVEEDGSRAVLPAEAVLPAAEDCALVPGEIAAVCEADVPYLGYEVTLPEGVEADGDTPLTITFLHPRGGEDHVVTDQPLGGRVLWPGASASEPKQWPGYVRNEDGSYTQTEGNYAWTREGVQVRFEVNPSYSTVVDYPPASSECANPPVEPIAAEDVTLVSDDEGSQLASTGATVAGAAAFAVLLVGGGALVLWLRRRVQA